MFYLDWMFYITYTIDQKWKIIIVCGTNTFCEQSLVELQEPIVSIGREHHISCLQVIRYVVLLGIKRVGVEHLLGKN